MLKPQWKFFTLVLSTAIALHQAPIGAGLPRDFFADPKAVGAAVVREALEKARGKTSVPSDLMGPEEVERIEELESQVQRLENFIKVHGLSPPNSEPSKPPDIRSAVNWTADFVPSVNSTVALKAADLVMDSIMKSIAKVNSSCIQKVAKKARAQAIKAAQEAGVLASSKAAPEAAKAAVKKVAFVLCHEAVNVSAAVAAQAVKSFLAAKGGDTQISVDAAVTRIKSEGPQRCLEHLSGIEKKVMDHAIQASKAAAAGMASRLAAEEATTKVNKALVAAAAKFLVDPEMVATINKTVHHAAREAGRAFEKLKESGMAKRLIEESAAQRLSPEVIVRKVTKAASSLPAQVTAQIIANIAAEEARKAVAHYSPEFERALNKVSGGGERQQMMRRAARKVFCKEGNLIPPTIPPVAVDSLKKA